MAELIRNPLVTMRNTFERSKAFGVFLVKPTGKVLAEDETFVEVIVDGRKQYARVSMPFGTYDVPSEKWLEKYKNEIGVWVSFEHGNYAHPVMVGICPLNNKTPKEGSDSRNISRFKTAVFREFYDDDAEEYYIKHIDTGNSVKITKEGIFIGDKDAEYESAVLGETLVGILDELISAITNITVVAPLGNTSTPINSTSFENIKNKLSSIKSEINKVQ